MAKTVVSFGGLEDFVQSGLIDDADVTFTDCHFGWTPPNYTEEPVVVFWANLVRDDDGTTVQQMWTCGGAGRNKQGQLFLEPSDDGKYLQTEAGFKLSTNANFYKLIETFIKLGAPLKAGGADASMLEGIRAHVARIGQTGRDGKATLTTKGQASQILLPTHLLASEKGKKGVKAASAPGAAATANNGASVDPDALHEAAVETIKAIIAEMPVDAKKTIHSVKLRATQLLMGSKHKTIRDPVVQQIINPEWLEENALPFGAMLSGDDLVKPRP